MTDLPATRRPRFLERHPALGAFPWGWFTAGFVAGIAPVLLLAAPMALASGSWRPVAGILFLLLLVGLLARGASSRLVALVTGLLVSVALAWLVLVSVLAMG